MKELTAYKIICKEADFLGLSFLNVLVDIEKWGTKMYSKRVVEAFNIISVIYEEELKGER